MAQYRRACAIFLAFCNKHCVWPNNSEECSDSAKEPSDVTCSSEVNGTVHKDAPWTYYCGSCGSYDEQRNFRDCLYCTRDVCGQCGVDGMCWPCWHTRGIPDA